MKQNKSAKTIGIIALIISIIALMNPHIVWDNKIISEDIKPYNTMIVYTDNFLVDSYETFNKNNFIKSECYGTNITKIENNYPSSGFQLTFNKVNGYCTINYYKEVWYLKWF